MQPWIEGSLDIVVAGNSTLTLECRDYFTRYWGLVGSKSNGITVALDITISDELRQEGDC
jgi:isoleucyl-tRNA synthetase